MKKLILVLATIFFAGQVQAVTVIVHPSNAASLDKSAISRIFLGKAKSFPGGGPAVPITLDEGTAGSEAFNGNVLNKSASQLKAYWSKLVFTGKGTPPKSVANDAEMIALISANPNMIGFIEGSGDGSVKVVGQF